MSLIDADDHFTPEGLALSDAIGAFSREIFEAYMRARATRATQGLRRLNVCMCAIVAKIVRLGDLSPARSLLRGDNVTPSIGGDLEDEITAKLLPTLLSALAEHPGWEVEYIARDAIDFTTVFTLLDQQNTPAPRLGDH